MYRLPINARRIDFNEIEVNPCDFNIQFISAPAARKRDTLRNEKGQFFVQIDERNPYLEELVRRAQESGLTVSGDGTAPVKGGDIRKAKKGDFVTFGSSSRFDVNWIKRPGYLCDNKYAPVYQLRKDWDKVNSAMENFARDKKSLTLKDGTDVRFHHNFAVINGKVYTYKKGEVAVTIPQEIVRKVASEMGIINIIIL